jgi:hypothetical protein
MNSLDSDHPGRRKMVEVLQLNPGNQRPTGNYTDLHLDRLGLRPVSYLVEGNLNDTAMCPKISYSTGQIIYCEVSKLHAPKIT